MCKSKKNLELMFVPYLVGIEISFTEPTAFEHNPFVPYLVGIEIL
ncbi:hypothetical protein THA_1952 [Thermosipho africanus TCF52B]|uniref:Uncharacterized protein n=1 Tax=Thermosipho africanus (strain TCF52B) TaxID=484019 RepID=B7IEE7_THEAB|nr:hypothetical protein THA_1952 [Thermosipho africanus TCF52B]